MDEGSDPGDEHLTAVAEAAEAMLIIENAPLPLAVVLPNARIALANRAMGEFLGYDPGELAGVNVRELSADEDGFEERWDDVISAKGVTNDRIGRLRRRDGVPVTARVASLVITDDNGSPRFVLARALSTRPDDGGDGFS